MKRPILFLTTLAAMWYLGTAAFAQHGGTAGGHGAAGSHGKSSSKAETGKETASKKTVGEQLAQNTKLASKLESLLGLSGPDAASELQADAAGFKNLGQFVAACHVSHNLGIPFDQLRAKMTDPPGESLGKAVQQLKPDARTKTEAAKAWKQAKRDINESRS